MLDIFSCFLLSRSPPKGPKPREGGLPFFLNLVILVPLTMLVFTANHHRQSFSAFAIRQNKVPLALQECHELLTMIHFITGNNHELLTMIHLSKHISLLNQQSVCNSPHHILTFSQLTVLSCMMMLIDSTVNCENVRE